MGKGSKKDQWMFLWIHLKKTMIVFLKEINN